MQMNIKQIGAGLLISKNQAIHSAYKCFSLLDRLRKKITKAEIEQNSSLQLIYHPFWLAKTFVIAARPPFPPKKSPNMIFVDAVSGYRGIFSQIPPITDQKISKAQLQTGMIRTKKEAKKYVKDVQIDQINRMYLLKKPEHEVIDLDLYYMPIWKVIIHTPLLKKIYFINANTGEPENFMAEKWRTKDDLM